MGITAMAGAGGAELLDETLRFDLEVGPALRVRIDDGRLRRRRRARGGGSAADAWRAELSADGAHAVGRIEGGAHPEFVVTADRSEAGVHAADPSAVGARPGVAEVVNGFRLEVGMPFALTANGVPGLCAALAVEEADFVGGLRAHLAARGGLGGAVAADERGLNLWFAEEEAARDAAARLEEHLYVEYGERLREIGERRALSRAARLLVLPRWTPHPAALGLLERMEEALAARGAGRHLLIVGEREAGKTYLAREFDRRHPPDGDETLTRPVFDVATEGGLDRGRIAAAFVRGFLLPRAYSESAEETARLAAEELGHIGIRVHSLVFDGLENLPGAHHAGERARTLDLMLRLGDELGAGLICLGLPRARRAVESHRAAAGRFDVCELPPLTKGEEFAEFCRAHVSVLPVEGIEYLAGGEMTEAAYRLSGGRAGSAARLHRKAALYAAAAGERLTAARLDEVGRKSFTELAALLLAGGRAEVRARLRRLKRLVKIDWRVRWPLD